MSHASPGSPDASDPLEALERVAEHLEVVVERGKLGEELARVERLVRDHADKFAQFDAVAEALCAVRGPLKLLPGRSNAIQEDLDAVYDLGSRLADARDRESLARAAAAFGFFPQALRRLEAAARDLWAEEVRVEFEPLHAVGLLLSRIDGIADLGSRLCSLVARGRRLKETVAGLHTLAGEVGPLRAEADRLRTEVDELTAAEPDVATFLRAVATGKAPLRLLTPGVLRWLGSLGALDAFEVGPRQ